MKIVVNKTVVRIMATIAMIFLLLLALKYRLDNFLIMGLLLLPNKISFIFNTPSFRNFPILNTDDPIRELGDLVVMGNHYKGLVKFLAAYFQQAKNITACPAVKVARRLVRQHNRRFRYQSACNRSICRLLPCRRRLRGYVVCQPWRILSLLRAVPEPLPFP